MLIVSSCSSGSWLDTSSPTSLSSHSSTGTGKFDARTQMHFSQKLDCIGFYTVSFPNLKTSTSAPYLTFIFLKAAPLETIGLFGFAWTSLGPPNIPWIAPMIFSTLIAIANVSDPSRLENLRLTLADMYLRLEVLHIYGHNRLYGRCIRTVLGISNRWQCVSEGFPGRRSCHVCESM